MNFNNSNEKVSLDENLYEDILSENKIEGEINLTPYGFKIMKRKSLI